MLNSMDPPFGGGEAQIRYLDGDYQILRNGNYVRCAITGRPILLQDLKYWSAEHQEPYIDAEAALTAYRRHTGAR
ncbi:conserved hypothetical protein [uncultured Pleomorphomonas sp.]|jgi:hypothetical protein|uniref:DUF2093 domain-containing protein n=3 Tax=Pleomorphomonas TaxID=261933 RepID=A0A2G9WZ40_9HYPH|nr:MULTISPECIES: DUF2093 domain-containing protein [Pleomorphomonas]PIO99562.1 DUF2093 domain-containing protein [Pleomorphomonas carboxyditropha]CAI9409816.1 hypothetical protein ANOBCDAF_02126 [Pleomorphomonas sp. T1.2MG-36]SCM76655.1 conserved hypothetical protein [uncultured Pleomorphomonas sp.]